MIGHFPEGAQVRASLAASKLLGVPFPQAWEDALHGAHLRRNGVPLSFRREDVAEALTFARAAFERAYNGEPRNRQDRVAQALLHAMEKMLDDSDDAGVSRRELDDLMQAA